jgi:hypothetical protein
VRQARRTSSFGGDVGKGLDSSSEPGRLSGRTDRLAAVEMIVVYGWLGDHFCDIVSEHVHQGDLSKGIWADWPRQKKAHMAAAAEPSTVTETGTVTMDEEMCCTRGERRSLR